MEATLARETVQTIPPQLDNIETTAIAQLPTCYADLKRSKHAIEFCCAEDLYKELDNADGKNRAENLRQCREFAYFARNSETGKVKIISNSCRLRWCPVCSEAKRTKIYFAVSEWLSHVRKPKFITLTMSHISTPLTEQIEALYRAFRLLRQHKIIRDAMRGGIWFLQVKRSESDNCWHPHLHIVADSDYIDKKLLSQDWLRTTGNSYIIDIRAVENDKEVCNYVSRYCAKPCKLSDFSEADRIEIANVLHGKRLCGKFGTGAKCNFKTERPADASLWQRLGNWSNFIINRPFDPGIQKIIRAYYRNEAVEYSVCEDFIHKENPPELEPVTILLSSKQRQLHIENWSSH